MIFLRKYATAATVDGVVLVTAGAAAFKANPTLATGDVKISKDGGAFANLGTLPVVTPASGRAVQVVLTDTELTCARAVIQFVDAAGAEWEDQQIIIETYGNASATHLFDLGTAVQDVNVTKLLGTAWETPTTAGRPNVNASHFANTAYATALIAEINALLDAVNTGATHNIANSVGKQIRQGAGGAPVVILTGTAQAGSTSNTIKLSSTGSATNNIYNGAICVIESGTGLGQTRKVVTYVGSTKFATVDKNWTVTPDNTSVFRLEASANSITSHEGTLQSATGTTAVLQSGASTVNSFYTGLLCIRSGTGSGQAREITGYVGSTLTATVATWSVTPDSTSVYAIIPSGAAVSDTVAVPTPGEIWDEILDGTLTGRQSMRLANAANAGKASGMGTSTAVLRDPADGKDRITATVDALGNRTAVTTDVT